jgi:hypothetical protein
MSLGSILVGLAVAVIVIAYIVRPFRAASGAAVSRTDKLIEAWVRATPTVAPSGPSGVEDSAPAPRAAVSTPMPMTSVPVVPPSSVPLSSGEVNFCPQCGRRVTAEYRFCPGCGALLPREEGAA